MTKPIRCIKSCRPHHSTEASRRCIEAGIDTIEHGCGLNDEMCEKMAEKGLFLIPTMLVVNRLLESDDKEEGKGAEDGRHPRRSPLCR
ncbi:MAG: hypothetical protein ACLTK0_00120 [Anaerovoracaceae bacterium]